MERNGIIDGPNFNYYLSGGVKGLAIVRNGHIDGKLVTYYESGKLKSLLELKNTVIKNGLAYRFFENGNLESIEINKDDTLCYGITLDSTGRIIGRFHKLYVEQKDNNINLGDTFTAYIRWYGPHDFKSYSYSSWDFKNEDLSDEENRTIRLSHALVPMKIVSTLDYSEIKVIVIPDRPGRHRFWGDVIFAYDSLEFSHHFEGEFVCEPSKEL